MVVEVFDWKPSTSAFTDDFMDSNNKISTQVSLEKLCAQFISNDSKKLSSSRPSHLLVWTLGLSIITVISLCAMVGIFVMKYLKKSIFNKFITFFVSVGVGSLSGSAVFHLLPQAFGLVEEFDVNASHTYLSRAFAAIVGIYLFFFSDKAIKIILEIKKRKKCGLTELAQINLNTNLSESLAEDSVNCSHSIKNKKNSTPGINSGRSCDALLISTEKNKVYETKLKKTNSESEESYNRQAHSLCVHEHDMQYKEGDSVIATVAWMIIFGDGLHNFIDGISIGASFSESILSGLSVSLAVICEEFPHELGDVAILVSAGMTLRQALVYNLLSTLTCYFGFVIGVVVGNLDDTFASYTFGFAGGMFLYISMACMMPEMKNAMEEALNLSFIKGFEVLALQVSGVSVGLITMAFMARYGNELTFE